MSKRKRSLLQPECATAIREMKYEIARELGIFHPLSELNNEFASELDSTDLDTHHIMATHSSFDWGQISSRAAGMIGGRITARLITQAQQSLLD